MELNKIYQGDSLKVLKTFPDESIDCCITSPPYWSLRDYNIEGQLGLEPTFYEYISKLCGIFDEVKRVLKKSGTCFVNLGDTYSGNKDGKTDNKVSNYLKENSSKIKKKAVITEKCLCQIPSRFAIEMADRNWILRNTIIWHKKNAMPSSVLDRFTNKYEQVFFFVKNQKYFFDGDAVRVPFETAEYSKAEYRASREERPPGIVRQREYGYNGKFKVENAESFGSPRARNSRKYNTAENTKIRDLEEISRKFGTRRPPGNDYERNPLGKNMGDVWTLVSDPFPEAHFATYPPSLVSPMIKSGCLLGGVILDPFFGAGTTGLVALQLNRKFVGIELSPEYVKIAEKRIHPYLNKLF